MTSQADAHRGVQILPIPPPLEFPYPQISAETLRAQSAAGTETSVTNEQNSTLDASSTVTRPTALQTSNLSQAKYPTPIREIQSPLGDLSAEGAQTRRRRQTGNKEADMLNAALAEDSDFDSDSSSSSDFENSSPPTPKDGLVNSQGLADRGRTSSTISQAKKVKHLAGERKGVDDPYSSYAVGNDDFKSRGRVSKRDGRLNIKVKGKGDTDYWAKALGATLGRHIPGYKDNKEENRSRDGLIPLREEDAAHRPKGAREGSISTLSTTPSVYDKHPVPKLNIVFMVIGSRGDIQPFLRLGKILKEEHGHRVRIATHPAFKQFVEKDSGLEFFSVGGDPAEIMAFMVKNPGLIPRAETIVAGEVGRRRESMYEMFKGFWRACINATDDETDPENLKMMGDKNPFVADAIIANPPSFAHVHCAERLGVPLHLIFTFPNSPTQQFPHPVTNIKQSNVDANYTNFMSYPLVEMMIWQGLGDLVNRFRVKTLGLEPLSTLWAPGQLFRMKVPYTYLWSPSLVPKPRDWGLEIDITGFVFLDLASSFKPPESLVKFLDDGDPPVYIGFGSIVVDNADKFTKLIFEAVKKAGVRALVSKGWGKLGDEDYTPENVYMLENTPHDWLFPRVSAVVHHGGAGSTAIGLKCGKPTLIVPFFGDQPFWGAMVAKSGAGAEPIPYKKLTSDKLAAGIKCLLTPEVQRNAEKIAKNIADEGDGALNAVKSFHRSLPLRGEHSLRCSILEDRVAVWHLKKTHVRLCAIAAHILVENEKLKWQDLQLIRHYDWNDFEGPGEPFTGAGAAVVSSVGAVVHGIGRTPFRWVKSVRKHEKKDQRKRGSEKRKEGSQQTSGTIKETPQTNEKHTAPGKKTGKAVKGSENDVSEKTVNGTNHDQGKERYLPGHDMNQHSLRKKAMSDTKAPNTHPSQADEHDHHHPETDKPTKPNLASEVAAETTSGFAKSAGALIKAPMNISLATAQGFHNAPRLYGDTTVRTPPRISGFKSGARAATAEFSFGIYDGFTGLVKHPYKSAKAEGGIGFAKGVGKGVGGLVLKNAAALLGPGAYLMKGLEKELGKGRQPTGFIRRSRISQGTKDLAALGPEERDQVLEAVAHGWAIIADVKAEVEAAKKKGLKGRWEVRKERKRWKRNGVFENVEQAGRALEARRRGEDLEEVFEAQRVELEKSRRPRRSGMGWAKVHGVYDSERERERKGRGRQGGGKGNGNGGERGGDGVDEEGMEENIAGKHTGTEVQDLAVSPGSDRTLVGGQQEGRVEGAATSMDGGGTWQT